MDEMDAGTWAMAPALDPAVWAARFPLVLMARCHYCGVHVPLGRANCGDTHSVCAACAAWRAAS